jgi:transposase-like protein
MDGLRRAFTPAVVLFVALPQTENETDIGVTEIPLELLPRRCPFCGERTIIGHGQRLKQAHDERHQQIWIRRGRCRPCRKTFTVMPDWSPPSGHYTLHCRQQAWDLLRQADGTWERSVPEVADASRSPEPSTVRRWAGRLLHLGQLLADKLWLATGCNPSTPPTILAWDWTAIRRILPLEASSP